MFLGELDKVAFPAPSRTERAFDDEAESHELPICDDGISQKCHRFNADRLTRLTHRGSPQNPSRCARRYCTCGVPQPEGSFLPPLFGGRESQTPQHGNSNCSDSDFLRGEGLLTTPRGIVIGSRATSKAMKTVRRKHNIMTWGALQAKLAHECDALFTETPGQTGSRNVCRVSTFQGPRFRLIAKQCRRKRCLGEASDAGTEEGDQKTSKNLQTDSKKFDESARNECPPGSVTPARLVGNSFLGLAEMPVQARTTDDTTNASLRERSKAVVDTNGCLLSQLNAIASLELVTDRDNSPLGKYRSRKYFKRQRRLEKENMRRDFDKLSPREAQAIVEVFERFDTNHSGSLDQEELLAALRDLGLRGSTGSERRAILRICMEAAGGSQERLSGNKRIFAVDCTSFAVKILPRVYDKLAEQYVNDQGKELASRFHCYGESARLSQDVLTDVGAKIGIDDHTVQQLLEERGVGKFMNFEEFVDLTVRGHVEVQRLRSRREREIKDEFRIPDELFDQFRVDIIHFGELFREQCANDTKAITRETAVRLMIECGVHVPGEVAKVSVDAILDELSDGYGADLDFTSFLTLIGAVRQLELDKAMGSCRKAFDKYDRDKNGVLTIREVSSLLADLDCAPRTRKEQEELAALIGSADVDGSGTIDFQEFQMLCQRVLARLRCIRFDEEVEFGIRSGFSEQQVRELRWISVQLDEDGTGKLDLDEVRAGLGVAKAKYTAEALQNAFSSLDADASGELDFHEFLELIRLLRDTDGTLSTHTSPAELPVEVRFIETRILRMTLAQFGLSKAYLMTLKRNELTGMFSTYMGVDTTTNLKQSIGICTVEGLLKSAARLVAGESFEVIRTDNVTVADCDSVPTVSAGKPPSEIHTT